MHTQPSQPGAFAVAYVSIKQFVLERFGITLAHMLPVSLV